MFKELQCDFFFFCSRRDNCLVRLTQLLLSLWGLLLFCFYRCFIFFAMYAINTENNFVLQLHTQRVTICKVSQMTDFYFFHVWFLELEQDYCGLCLLYLSPVRATGERRNSHFVLLKGTPQFTFMATVHILTNVCFIRLIFPV